MTYLGKRAIIGVVITTTVLTACGGAPSGPNTLSYVSWGGALQNAQTQAILTPFGEEKGIEIRQESPTDYAKLKAQVEAGAVSWDVVQVEPYMAKKGCDEGWLTVLPDSVRVPGVIPAFQSKCAVPAFQYSFNIAYNKNAFPGEHPMTWSQFFDTAKFPGKRGFWKSSTSGILEAALLADGVPKDKLYPLDLDRAFAKLNTIKNDIVFYDTGEQQTQLISSGEVSLIQAWNGRMYDAMTNGQPVGLEWNDHMVVHETWVVPKGAPHEASALAFLAYATGPDPQARLTQYIPQAPINDRAFGLVDPKMAASLPTAPANAAKASVTIDYDWYADHFDDVSNRFNAWLLTF